MAFYWEFTDKSKMVDIKDADGNLIETIEVFQVKAVRDITSHFFFYGAVDYDGKIVEKTQVVIDYILQVGEQLTKQENGITISYLGDKGNSRLTFQISVKKGYLGFWATKRTKIDLFMIGDDESIIDIPYSSFLRGEIFAIKSTIYGGHSFFALESNLIVTAKANKIVTYFPFSIKNNIFSIAGANSAYIALITNPISSQNSIFIHKEYHSAYYTNGLGKIARLGGSFFKSPVFLNSLRILSYKLGTPQKLYPQGVEIPKVHNSSTSGNCLPSGFVLGSKNFIAPQNFFTKATLHYDMFPQIKFVPFVFAPHNMPSSTSFFNAYSFVAGAIIQVIYHHISNLRGKNSQIFCNYFSVTQSNITNIVSDSVEKNFIFGEKKSHSFSHKSRYLLSESVFCGTHLWSWRSSNKTFFMKKAIMRYKNIGEYSYFPADPNDTTYDDLTVKKEWEDSSNIQKTLRKQIFINPVTGLEEELIQIIAVRDFYTTNGTLIKGYTNGGWVTNDAFVKEIDRCWIDENTYLFGKVRLAGAVHITNSTIVALDGQVCVMGADYKHNPACGEQILEMPELYGVKIANSQIYSRKNTLLTISYNCNLVATKIDIGIDMIMHIAFEDFTPACINRKYVEGVDYGFYTGNDLAKPHEILIHVEDFALNSLYCKFSLISKIKFKDRDINTIYADNNSIWSA